MLYPSTITHSSNYIMTLSGQGHVMVAPDLAVIRLGVQTTGNILAQIQSENAQISQRIIDTLRQAGISDIADIKTIQYTIDKVYDYQNGIQIDKGYLVQNILEIQTPNITQVGAIIDAAVNMGANTVQSISFELAKPDLYYQQALNLAVDNVIQKAKSISGSLSVKLNPIPIRITEGGAQPVPMRQLQSNVAATPILSGELRIEAFITADFIYAK